MHSTNGHEKTFWIKKKVTVVEFPGTQNGFLSEPYLQYEQILLTKNFRQNLENIKKKIT